MSMLGFTYFALFLVIAATLAILVTMLSVCSESYHDSLGPKLPNLTFFACLIGQPPRWVEEK